MRARLVATATLAALLAVGMAAPAQAAPANSIVGTVTRELTPLQSVTVTIEAAAGDYTASAVTGSDGRYTLTDVPAGEYYVHFDTQSNPGEHSRDMVSVWYPDVLFRDDADTVELLAGGSLTVDASLAYGGTIEGGFNNTLTSGVTVRAFQWNPTGQDWVVQASVGTLGDYALRGLPPGAEIVLWYQHTGPDRLAAEFYSDDASFATAHRVTVIAKDTVAVANVTLGPGGPVAASRVAGADRFATAALLAADFDTADTVFIANGLNFPDALGAAPVAALQGGPLLLVTPTALPAVASEQLSRLQPSNVVIMGSTASVSAGVESQVESLLPGATVDRIAGTDRFETSRMLARYAFPDGANKVFLVTGTNFPDALSVASVATLEDAPIILVNGSAGSLDAATKELILELGATDIDGISDIDIEIVGSPASVSMGIYNDIFAMGHGVFVSRFGGADRYETSAMANYPYSSRPADKVYLATGFGFADALAGGAVAGRDGAPLFIVPGTCIPSEVRQSIYDISPQEIVLLGGTPSLSAAVASLTPC